MVIPDPHPSVEYPSADDWAKDGLDRLKELIEYLNNDCDDYEQAIQLHNEILELEEVLKDDLPEGYIRRGRNFQTSPFMNSEPTGSFSLYGTNRWEDHE